MYANARQRAKHDRPPRASLLGLTGELRNQIYRLAIVGPDRVTIDAANPVPPQPGLLRTCRQLRNETLDIFYRENSFRYRVVDLKLPMRPDYPRATVSKYVVSFAGISTGTHVLNWQNFYRWLKDYHYHRANRFLAGHSTHSIKALCGAFKIVRQLRTNPQIKWEEVEKVLEAWKESVAFGGAITWT